MEPLASPGGVEAGEGCGCARAEPPPGLPGPEERPSAEGWQRLDAEVEAPPALGACCSECATDSIDLAPGVADDIDRRLLERQVSKRLGQLVAMRAQEQPHYRRVVELFSTPVEGGPRRAARTAKELVAESGSALVVDEALGLPTPLDDEHAVRADRIYRRDDWTREDESGRVFAGSEVVSRVRSAPADPCDASSEGARMPSRAVMMAAGGGLRAVLDDLRRTRISEARAARSRDHARQASPPPAQLDGLDESFLCTGLPTPVIGTPPDSSSCGGASGTLVTPFQSSRVAAINGYAYLDDGYDGAGEEGLAPWAVGDEIVGYGTGGAGYDNRPLVVLESQPHVVVTVIENSTTTFPDPTHPAFLTPLGENRARYFIENDGTVLGSGEFGRLNVAALSGSEATHGTATAGVALASVMEAQDSQVVGEGDREGRSGVARRAYAVFSATSSPDTFDILQGYWMGYSVLVDGQLVLVDSESLQGTDIVVQSQPSNTGTQSYGPANDQTPCPTDDEARGLDPESLRVLQAYLDDSAIYVKSAGNGHDPSGLLSAAAVCGPSKKNAPYEVSSPGTSAAAIAVGSLKTGGIDGGYSPAEMQRMETLQDNTEGCVTPDGRVYPSLVVNHYSCGVAGTWTDSTGAVVQGYVQHGMTSGAAPTVAGAAAVFKHWYLYASGPEFANQPGRMISNILNMADGVAFDAWSGGARAAPPAPGWGLGRFRLRRYARGHMSPPWYRHTSAVTLTEEDPVDLLWLAGDEAEVVPEGTKRMVITLWWLEVNTGEGEEKADIEVSLYRMDETAGWTLVDARESAGDCRIRMQYDCYDWYFGFPPTGRVLLVARARSVPTELRGAERSSRTVYVSWYWEGGPDLSLIGATAATCAAPRLDLCVFQPIGDETAGAPPASARCRAPRVARRAPPVTRDRVGERLVDDLEGLLRAVKALGQDAS